MEQEIEVVRIPRSRAYLQRLCIDARVATTIERKITVAREALKEMNRAINALLDDPEMEFSKSEYSRMQKLIYSEAKAELRHFY